jgi:membrane-associated phospholipid phosphatase
MLDGDVPAAERAGRLQVRGWDSWKGHGASMIRRPVPVSLLVLIVMMTCPAGGAGAGDLPYELETSREVSLFVAGGILGAGALVVFHQLDPLTAEDVDRLDREDVNAFDRGATDQWSVGAGHASDALLYVIIPAPVALAAFGEGSEQPAVPLTMYAETMLLTNSVVGLLKGSIHRTRPFVYNDDPEIPSDDKLTRRARLSFPSGHSANAFAAAVFTGKVYGDLYPHSGAKGWVWGAALAVATTTASLRYVAGDHYPTDILAGAAIGAAIGYGVPRLHQVSNGHVELGAGPILSFSFSL